VSVCPFTARHSTLIYIYASAPLLFCRTALPLRYDAMLSDWSRLPWRHLINAVRNLLPVYAAAVLYIVALICDVQENYIALLSMANNRFKDNFCGHEACK